MAPNDTNSFNHRKEQLASGRSYHFIDQEPKGYSADNCPTILCIHGFPDCWVAWKHQIQPWVETGYRVVVPDMLGYGETDKPEDPSEYSFKKLSNDLADILGAIGVGKAFVIGHDWGAHLAGRFALWHQELVLGVVFISIGYFPPASSWRTLKETVEGTIYEYQLYFANEDCIQELEGNLRNFFKYAFHSNVFSGPQGIPEKFGDIVTGRTEPSLGAGKFLLSDQIITKELDDRVAGNKTMRGPTNYYRTSDIRNQEEYSARLYEINWGVDLGIPVLFLRGGQDATSTVEAWETTERLCSAKVIVYNDAAHWLMIEKKEEVVNDVLDWLRQVRGL